MHLVWIALAGGAAAFAHCLGMCGPLALHLCQTPGRGRLLANQLLWQTGRITTYVFLGALAGLGGNVLTAWRVPHIQNLLAYVAGGAMILMGLVLLGVRPWRWGRFSPRQAGAAPQDAGLAESVWGQFLRQPTPAWSLVLGLATGLLPCPVVMAFLALAVQSGSVAMGMAVMGAMGVGTAWSLLMLPLAGGALRVSLRRWGSVLAGAAVLLMGAATVLRGTDAFHHLLGCPQAPARQDAPAGESPKEPASLPCHCGNK